MPASGSALASLAHFLSRRLQECTRDRVVGCIETGTNTLSPNQQQRVQELCEQLVRTFVVGIVARQDELVAEILIISLPQDAQGRTVCVKSSHRAPSRTLCPVVKCGKIATEAPSRPAAWERLDFLCPLTSKNAFGFEISGPEITGLDLRAFYQRKRSAPYRPHGEAYPRFQSRSPFSK